jgi:hypothetical protein
MAAASMGRETVLYNRQGIGDGASGIAQGYPKRFSPGSTASIRMCNPRKTGSKYRP